jgi:hypothetical protein
VLFAAAAASAAGHAGAEETVAQGHSRRRLLAVSADEDLAFITGGIGGRGLCSSTFRLDVRTF